MVKRTIKKIMPSNNVGATTLAYMLGEKEINPDRRRTNIKEKILVPSAVEFINRQLELERKAKEKKQRYNNIGGGI